MWLLPLTFALTFAVIFGVYWALIVRPEQSSHDRVWTRLIGPKSARAVKVGPIVRDVSRMSSIPALDSVFGRSGAAAGRVRKLLDSADSDMSVGRFVLGSLLLGIVAYLAVAVLFQQRGTALLVGLFMTMVPTFYMRRQRTVRLLKFEEQFPEAIELIARALRAGHGLTSGLGMVGDEVPNPIAREFKLLYEWQNFGMPLDEALIRFADRIPLLDTRFFVTAVLTQRESGGNLAEILDNLGRVIRDRFRVKRQIRVLSAHGRITGAVLSGMPPALAGYFFMTRPDYITTLATDPLGVRMVMVALGLQILGMLIIRRLVDIEY
jgi:tight adherence protein B